MSTEQNDTNAGTPSPERLRSATVIVADIIPFWRWAVGPTVQNHPAIPYYTRTKAEAFFEKTKRELPWAGVCLYRRRWFRGVETVIEYVPNTAVTDG